MENVIYNAVIQIQGLKTCMQYHSNSYQDTTHVNLGEHLADLLKVSRRICRIVIL